MEDKNIETNIFTFTPALVWIRAMNGPRKPNFSFIHLSLSVNSLLPDPDLFSRVCLPTCDLMDSTQVVRGRQSSIPRYVAFPSHLALLKLERDMWNGRTDRQSDIGIS